MLLGKNRGQSLLLGTSNNSRDNVRWEEGICHRQPSEFEDHTQAPASAAPPPVVTPPTLQPLICFSFPQIPMPPSRHTR